MLAPIKEPERDYRYLYVLADLQAMPVGKRVTAIGESVYESQLWRVSDGAFPPLLIDIRGDLETADVQPLRKLIEGYIDARNRLEHVECYRLVFEASIVLDTTTYVSQWSLRWIDDESESALISHGLLHHLWWLSYLDASYEGHTVTPVTVDDSEVVTTHDGIELPQWLFTALAPLPGSAARRVAAYMLTQTKFMPCSEIAAKSGLQLKSVRMNVYDFVKLGIVKVRQKTVRNQKIPTYRLIRPAPEKD